MKQKQLSLYANNHEFSICCAERLDDQLIIHGLRRIYEKSLVERFLQDFKDTFEISNTQKLLLNISPENFKKLSTLESMGFKCRMNQITDWVSILTLCRAITSKYIRFTSKKFNTILGQSILENIGTSRRLGVYGGSVALFCDNLPMGDWSDINALSSALK